jgi:hypothetical protein
MSDDQSDQTEAELERTRRVVAAAMAEQIAVNDAAASVTPEAAADEGDESSEGEEDLSKLYKSELVDRAEAAGIDTAGMSKAEIVEALEAQEGVS